MNLLSRVANDFKLQPSTQSRVEGVDETLTRQVEDPALPILLRETLKNVSGDYKKFPVTFATISQ